MGEGERLKIRFPSPMAMGEGLGMRAAEDEGQPQFDCEPGVC
jgi:hypothetical protein